MKGLKMAARKTITHSQSPHTYTLWQIRQRQNQWDQAPTCTAVAQQVYLNQLLVLQQQKNTCNVYNNKVPSKQGEILRKEGQILLVEEVHDHPDNNTIGAILVQDFFNSIHTPPTPPTTVAQDTLPGRQNPIVTQEKPCLHYQEWQRNYM